MQAGRWEAASSLEAVLLPPNALYYVCEDRGGTCVYRRQDINLAIPVRQP